MLPNFLIIGSSRSGTTYLKNNLEQHPDVFMAAEGAYTGDIHFFNKTHPGKKWAKGLEWYEKFFEPRTNEKAIGQKSGLYFSDPLAPELIKDTLGESVKLISTLRNPIERAYSSYWYQHHSIPKDVSFLEACKLELEGKFVLESQLHNPGLYSKHLKNYLQYFKKEQVHFIVFDFMKNDPLGELSKVFSFLEVDENFIPKEYQKKVNQATAPGGPLSFLQSVWSNCKQKDPVLSSNLKKFKGTKLLRSLLGKTTEVAATRKGYPKISLEEWNYLSEYYYASNKEMSDFLDIDLVSMWHKKPKHLEEGQDIK